MKKKKWRKRVRGSPRQVGKPFILDSTSQQTKKANLPKAKGKVHTRYPTGKVVRYSIEDMPLEQLSTKATIIQDPNPENFEARVQHFVDMYKRGDTIPPILFHRLKDGRIQILDGRARMEAFRRMGIPRIPAVENSILSKIKSGMSKFVSGTKGVREGFKGFKKGDQPKTVAQAVGRRTGVMLREGAKKIGQVPKKVETASLKTAKALGEVAGFPQAIQEAYAVGKAEMIGKGRIIGRQEGGGDIVMPLRRSREPVTEKKPLIHRPCVVEKKVKGKVLRTYGTLLDPRTNPRYLQKHGYTDVE